MNEAELVLSEILACNRASLYAGRHRRLGAHAGGVMSGILKRRCAGESLYYIMGKIEFLGLEFRVTPDCLVPRPETELLVETVVSCASSRPGFSILDIGTGSGCIAISCARMLPSARITATDISAAALDVARDNARRLGAYNRIHFAQADLFPPEPRGSFDCIVANPPYIPTGDIEGLSAEVRSEPLIALDGGPDGLRSYCRIIEQAHRYLNNKGILAMEMGFDQSKAVRHMLDDSKKYKVKEVIVDYNGIQRIITAIKD